MENENFSYRSWPFYWLSRAGGRYLLRMEELLRLVALDMPRWRVLMTLHQDRIATVSEIAEHSSTKLPTMTRIVQRMEADGLVSRQVHPGNERIQRVALTDRGEDAGNAAWLAADRIYGQAFAGMRDAEIEELSRLLRRVAENLRDPVRAED